ncbi:hypothetical protein MBLNU13_g08007t3 [Cladosporium sp. NU13]
MTAANNHPKHTNDDSEKGKLTLEESDNVSGHDGETTHTPSAVRRSVLKVDLCILPFIMLCFCFLQFDRTNISNALTDTLRTDINVGNDNINLAQTLFTVGFIITEIPFNIISKRIGPERFLPITMILWGIVTWSQIFIKNASGLYAARFFVGALEGGYIPGFALYISRYYTNRELGLRFVLFWASNSIAGALAGPLAIGLLSLRGRSGLAGWQWLFLIEGVLTCILGAAAYVYLPHNAAAPKVFFGKSIKIFNRDEAMIIVDRVTRDDPSKADTHKRRVLPSHMFETFADWRIYGHLVAGLLSMVMIAPMNTYAPSIIKSLGFTSLQANGLNAVGSVCALVWSISLAYSSDRSAERGLHIATGYLFGAAGLLWLALAPTSVGKWTLYGGVVWTQMSMGSAQALTAAWLTAKMEDHKRPIALAAYVMSIQLANFPGNQLFRAEDETSATGYVDSAPVFQIRDAATEVGVGTPAITDISQSPQSSRRITDSIDASTARTLLEIHCVGTRRPAAVSQKQIQHLVRSADHNKLSNFEMRMVAEVKLYWLIYQMSSASSIGVSSTDHRLVAWRDEHASLFDQPRSQFLQLGLDFAHLLADCESLKASKAAVSDHTLSGVIQSSKTIINIFLDTTDERTRHLTDHVYNVVTFAAITLCRILQSHRDQLQEAGHDLSMLHKLIEAIIAGLSSVGLPCHAASMLASVVSARFARLQTTLGGTGTMSSEVLVGEFSDSVPEAYTGLDDYTFMYPDFSRTDLFDVGLDVPQWDPCN